MKRLIILAPLVSGVVFFGSCAKNPPEGKTPADLQRKLCELVEKTNSYVAGTGRAALNDASFSRGLLKISDEFGALHDEATKLNKYITDTRYAEVAMLAQEGAERTAALADATRPDTPWNYVAFAAARDSWAEFNDRVVANPALASNLPGGKGKHYGWWKNPTWAQDPMARETASPPGACEPVRERTCERERERLHGGKGKAKGGSYPDVWGHGGAGPWGPDMKGGKGRGRGGK